MLMLVFGVLLWSLAHLLKRIVPDSRARLGNGGKLVVTLALIGSIALMTSGYESASGDVWWARQAGWTVVTNVLMLIAVYLFVSSALKTRVAVWCRHPQLIATNVWSVAHLLVNGDMRSLVLFGGLFIWAVVTVWMINRQDGKPALPLPNTSGRKELMGFVLTALGYIALASVHGYLGYPVYG